jgi:hypothetical protein
MKTLIERGSKAGILSMLLNPLIPMLYIPKFFIPICLHPFDHSIPKFK